MNDRLRVADSSSLMDILMRAGMRKDPLDKDSFMELLDLAISSQNTDSPDVRPRDDRKRPGGVIKLRTECPVIIIPDIHGRSQLLLSVLQLEYDGNTVLHLMQQDRLQILCLGDAFHTEVNCQEQWLKAFSEFQEDFEEHEAMDREMLLNLRTLEILLRLKVHFGPGFHFLKGNHENISNENENGNYSFGKYAHEGDMVKRWCQKFYGDDYISKMTEYERNLPLLAVGESFLASHAEPEDYYSYEDILNYRDHPDVVYGLTWTTNDRDRLSSVWSMLEDFLPQSDKNEKQYYFGGHRHITGRYHLRAGRKFVQIHNPEKYIIALIRPGKEIELDRDIMELE